jgi:putative oxidoreductase
MSTKIKSIAVASARVVLGLIFFVFGLNFFLHFLPTPPSAGGVAESFVGGLFQSGYFFPVLKGIEVVAGALLLARLFVPLTLVILAPISLHILLFHVFLAPESVAMSVVILALNLYLAWAYRDYYKPLLQYKSAVTL